MRKLESGELKVVGVNTFTEALPSPLEGEGSIPKVDPALEAQTIAEVQAWRSERDNDAVKRALDELRRAAGSDEKNMPAPIALAHAGGTTGARAAVPHEAFGQYPAPTGLAAPACADRRRPG